jgi:hypothetical protein
MEVVVNQVQEIEDNDQTDRPNVVVVHVNNLPVELGGHCKSGAQIKGAAIAQGVGIRPDFVLYEEIGHDRTRHIADDEIVAVTNATRFLADAEIITIQVNGHPVRLEGRRHTGLQIKEAAIAQSVKIKPDFILFEILGPGHTREIKDEETVEIKHHSKFDAIPDDDQS